MFSSRLVLLPVLVCTMVALAVGTAASSASRPTRSAAAAPLLLHFQYLHLPPDLTAQVTFSDGVQGIGTQTVAAKGSSTGTIYGFVAHQRGFAITPATGGPLDASIDAQVQPTDGSSVIHGQAPLASGATLTVQVNGAAAIPITGKFAIQLPTLAGAAPKPHPAKPQRPVKPQRPTKPACRAHKHRGGR